MWLAPLDAAPLAAGGDRAADVGRAGRQRVPSLAVALLAVARFAPPLVLGAALPAPSATCLHVSSSKERRGSPRAAAARSVGRTPPRPRGRQPLTVSTAASIGGGARPVVP